MPIDPWIAISAYAVLSYVIGVLVARYMANRPDYSEQQGDKIVIFLMLVCSPLILPIMMVIFICYWIYRVVMWVVLLGID